MKSLLLQAVLAVFVGVALILLAIQINGFAFPEEGEYYYSKIVRNNYTKIMMLVYLVAGAVLGYVLQLKPWLIGILLVSYFFLITAYEATVYRGSHNLLPLELAMYLFFAIPPVGGAYIGYLIKRSKEKSSI
jgi:ABC-type iron transport system FetAB permease component